VHYITLEKIAYAIVGDGEPRDFAPYRTWNDLYAFFDLLQIERLTQDEIEKANVTSRVKYSKAVLKKIINSQKINLLIEELFRDIYFTNCNEEAKEKLLEYLNKCLSHENFKIKKAKNGKYSLCKINKDIINEVDVPFQDNSEITKEFIVIQIIEAQKRIEEENYWAAITASKSLLEGVFSYIDKEINGKSTINPKEDLIKQYSSIKSILSLDASQKNLSDSLKQILQGLNSIVCGLSFFRNKMSDAHLPQYKAEKHHAVLAVNSANTLAQFLFDTYEYQFKNSKREQYIS
jgi:hypothetical protein